MSPSSTSSSSPGLGGDFFDLSSSLPGRSFFLPVPPMLFPLIGWIEALRQRHGHICTLTSIPPPLAGILTAVRQSFLPFSNIQCKGRRNQSTIRKSGNRFSLGTNAKRLPGDHAQVEKRDHGPIQSDHDPGAIMKKPKIEAEEQQPRKIIRADKAPTTGYSLVVDGHFKSHHDTVEAAEEAGMALKNQYQMLQVQVYDAATKTRSMIEWPAPV